MVNGERESMTEQVPNETGNGPPDDDNLQRLAAAVVCAADVRQEVRGEGEHLDAGWAEFHGVGT
jgi:hypothetical protein